MCEGFKRFLEFVGFIESFGFIRDSRVTKGIIILFPLDIIERDAGWSWGLFCCDWREAADLFTAYQWGKPQP
jgi:hypothetical protein